MLGSRSVPLAVPTITRDTAWVNPMRRFPRSTPMQLYFELAGVPAGTPYQVTLAVVRQGTAGFLGRREKAALSLGFGGETRGGVAAIPARLSSIAPTPRAAARPIRWILPVDPLGTSLTIRTMRGTLKSERRAAANSITSFVVSVAPARATTATPTSSPRRACGTAKATAC